MKNLFLLCLLMPPLLYISGGYVCSDGGEVNRSRTHLDKAIRKSEHQERSQEVQVLINILRTLLEYAEYVVFCAILFAGTILVPLAFADHEGKILKQPVGNYRPLFFSVSCVVAIFGAFFARLFKGIPSMLLLE